MEELDNDVGAEYPQDDYLSLIGTSEEDDTGDDADVTGLTSHRVLSEGERAAATPTETEGFIMSIPGMNH